MRVLRRALRLALLAGLSGCAGTGGVAPPDEAPRAEPAGGVVATFASGRFAFGPLLNLTESPEVLPRSVWYRHLDMECRPPGTGGDGERTTGKLVIECYARGHRPEIMKQAAEELRDNMSKGLRAGQPAAAAFGAVKLTHSAMVDLRARAKRPTLTDAPAKALSFTVECSLRPATDMPAAACVVLGGGSELDEAIGRTAEAGWPAGVVIESAPAPDSLSASRTIVVKGRQLREYQLRFVFRGPFKAIRAFVERIEDKADRCLEFTRISIDSFNEGLSPGAGELRATAVLAAYVADGR